MSEQLTANCGLPLVQPAQAQKHVTVNQGLMRLDGLVNLVLQGLYRSKPPVNVIDGQCWAVPEGALNAWENHAGQIAIGANGGWVFVDPFAGQRAFVADQGVSAIHDGDAWRAGALTMGALGGGLRAGLAEGEVSLQPGARTTSPVEIPAGVMVIGASARVSEAITGTAKSWSLGTDDGVDRFGQGLGLELGSWARGILSQPMTYWNAKPLIITAQEGKFDAGRISLAVHWLELGLPR